MRPSSFAEESIENVQWSNADIEFPSTSTSDEIEIISQPADDETICKLLSALTTPSETKHNPSKIDSEQNTDELNVPPDLYGISDNIESGKFHLIHIQYKSSTIQKSRLQNI